MKKLHKCSCYAISVITAVAGMLISGITVADPVTGLNTFVPGQPATAASVNDNFSEVQTSVNDNDSRITTNTGDIADNFSLINDNATDITTLQSGNRPAARTFIDIDCNANSDVLLQPPYTDNFYPYTTFNITGDCNGPLYITSDGVHLVGAEANRGASIVLPAATPTPGDGAIFIGGGHDVRIENLTVDASAWGSFAVAGGTDAAGVYVRNAFVRLIDVDVIGGLWGVNPFRGGIVRTEGVINITAFVNAGISVGEASVVSARGQVNVSTSVTDGDYLAAVEAYRGGVADFRGGLNLTVPADKNAVETGNFGTVRVRPAGTVSVTGNVVAYRIGIFDMRAGSLVGNIDASSTSRVQLANMTQSGGNIVVNTGSHLTAGSGSTVNDMFLNANATANIWGGTTVTGEINLTRGSSLQMSESTQEPGTGLVMYQNSSAEVINSTIGIIELYKASTLNLYESNFDGGLLIEASTADIWDTVMTQQGLTVEQAFLYYNAPGGQNYLNGHTIFQCNAFSANIDANVASTGSLDCP